MGVGPAEAKRLTYWEFTALRHEWAERHKVDGDDQGEPVEAPTEEFVRARQAELASLGISGSVP